MTIREKLIKILKVPIFPHLDADPAEVVADYLLDNGVTVQQWIPVSEKMPEESGFHFEDMGKAVLFYTPVDGCMHIGWYIGKDWRGRDTWNTLSVMRSVQTCKKKVTHWMPLPEPPQEEKR